MASQTQQNSEHPTQAGPIATIGMPVYNGATTIAKAIDAILAQSITEFELVISDNASTDETLSICERYAAEDPRIRIIRQSENRGPVKNFHAVLAAARAPYFMFAAADDHIEPDFLAESLDVLDRLPHAIACAPRTLIHFADGRTREARGSHSIAGPAWTRLIVYLFRPADNSRFYGLYRTRALQRSFPNEDDFLAYDWLVTALTLAEGSHVRSRSIILHRDGAEAGKYLRSHLRSTSSHLDRWLPLARMTKELLARLSPALCIAALPMLLILNIRQSLEFGFGRLRGHG